MAVQRPSEATVGRLTDENEFIHVYPLFGREHVLSMGCWCHPEPLFDLPIVIEHNVEH